MSEEYGTIRVPKELIDKIRARVEATEFSTVDEYATYVLEEVMKSLEDDREEVFSEEDEEAAKDRLRSLGYLD